MSNGVFASRKVFRNLVLLVGAAFMGISYFILGYGQDMRIEIQTLEFERIALTQELQNTARRSASLAELDGLTISEAEATRLNIMRHLGLEQSNYDFEITSRQVRQVGETELYTREAVLQTQLAYADTMTLMDRLYNTGKFAVKSIELKPGDQYGDKVNLRLVGNIYALRKEGQEQLPPAAPQAQALPAAEGTDIPPAEDANGLLPPRVEGQSATALQSVSASTAVSPEVVAAPTISTSVTPMQEPAR